APPTCPPSWCRRGPAPRPGARLWRCRTALGGVRRRSRCPGREAPARRRDPSHRSRRPPPCPSGVARVEVGVDDLPALTSGLELGDTPELAAGRLARAGEVVRSRRVRDVDRLGPLEAGGERFGP